MWGALGSEILKRVQHRSDQMTFLQLLGLAEQEGVHGRAQAPRSRETQTVPPLSLLFLRVPNHFCLEPMQTTFCICCPWFSHDRSLVLFARSKRATTFFRGKHSYNR